jgi:hypothetical protein
MGDWPQAIEFYKEAFNVVESSFVLGRGVARVSIDGAEFRATEESSRPTRWHRTNGQHA